MGKPSLAKVEYLIRLQVTSVSLIFLEFLFVSYVEESKAGDAVAAMMASLSLNAKVKRDDKWITVEAAVLVPGDLVAVKLGDVMPADIKMSSGENVKVDQSGMTGESLPVEKKVGDMLYSGYVLYSQTGLRE